MQSLRDFLAAEWPIDEIVKGGVLVRKGSLVLAGELSIGKSTVAMNLAYDLAAGQAIFGGALPICSEQTRVLYVENEIGPPHFQQRLRRLSRRRPSEPAADNLFIHSLGMESGLILTLNNHEAWQSMLAAVKPDVVILDPLAAFYTGDENDEQQVGNLTRLLELWSSQFGCAWILIHHFKKPQPGFDQNVVYRVRGSSRLIDWAQSRLLLSLITRTPEHRVVLDFAALRLGPPRQRLLLKLTPDFEALAVETQT